MVGKCGFVIDQLRMGKFLTKCTDDGRIIVAQFDRADTPLASCDKHTPKRRIRYCVTNALAAAPCAVSRWNHAKCIGLIGTA